MTLWNNTKCNIVLLKSTISYMGHGYSPKVAHIHKAYGSIGQSKESTNTLYRTLVQDLNVKHIGKIVKRVVGRMTRLWIYHTLEMMKIGKVLWWVGNWIILILG